MNRLSVIMANKKSEALKGSGFFYVNQKNEIKGVFGCFRAAMFLLLFRLYFCPLLERNTEAYLVRS